MEIKLEYGTCSWTLKKFPTKKALKIAKRIGFECFQWNPILIRGKTYHFKRIEETRGLAKKLGMNMPVLHLPHLPSPKIPFTFIEESVNAAKLMESPFLLIHPLAYKDYVTFFQKTAKLCHQNGILLTLENTCEITRNIANQSIPCLHSTHQLRKLLTKIGFDNVGITYDCNHAIRTQHNPIKFYKSVSEHVNIIHISDATKDGKIAHDSIGKGEINFKTLFREIKATGFDGPIIIEIKPDIYEQLEENLNIVKELSINSRQTIL